MSSSTTSSLLLVIAPFSSAQSWKWISWWNVSMLCCWVDIVSVHPLCFFHSLLIFIRLSSDSLFSFTPSSFVSFSLCSHGDKCDGARLIYTIHLWCSIAGVPADTFAGGDYFDPGGVNFLKKHNIFHRDVWELNGTLSNEHASSRSFHIKSDDQLPINNQPIFPFNILVRHIRTFWYW